MKNTLCVLAMSLVGGSLQAGINKSFPSGYIVCVFDHASTMVNHGNKLEVSMQDPTTHRWIPLPFLSDPSAPPWIRKFVTTDSPTDEIDSEGTLTIKRPVTIVFWNFKGGVVDVEFSAAPKSIKHLRQLPQLHG